MRVAALPIAGSPPHPPVAEALRKPSADWKRSGGRPTENWLRSIEEDFIRTVNLGMHVWMKAVVGKEWWTEYTPRRSRRKEKRNS